MRGSLVLFLWLLSGCGAVNPWKIDAIASGSRSFDSARLIHRNPSSPLQLEFIRSGEEIVSFLSLTQFWFHPSSADSQTVQVQFLLGEERLEEALPLLEGRMRLRLSPQITQSLLLALQDGKTVRILADGFEETFLPGSFLKLHDQWTRSSIFLQNPLKGPLE